VHEEGAQDHSREGRKEEGRVGWGIGGSQLERDLSSSEMEAQDDGNKGKQKHAHNDAAAPHLRTEDARTANTKLNSTNERQKQPFTPPQDQQGDGKGEEREREIKRKEREREMVL
jgi:hypothetical protein